MAEGSVGGRRMETAEPAVRPQRFVGVAVARPPIPADVENRDEEAWDDTWDWFRSDAIIIDGWRKLCWRQCAGTIDRSTGVLIGGPLELNWVECGSNRRWPAFNVDGPTADAAVFKFKQLYPGAAVPPIQHHMQPVYSPIWKLSVLLGPSPSSPCMWLY